MSAKNTKPAKPSNVKPVVTEPQPAETISTKPVKSPILKFTLKMAFLTAIVFGVIYYSDEKGYFNPDETNNHVAKKWDALYEMQGKTPVDVLLVGNSHLYTGINPENLSNALGATSFIMAAPGTNITDTYFSLKEALTICKPGVVVVETYGIDDAEQHELKEGELSDQFKSFSARKNFGEKLASTTQLFSTDNYLYAWSNTLRNHDYIFTNRPQLEANQRIIEREEGFHREVKKDLYLGRYIRFRTGLTDSLLGLYSKKGAPVNGKKYRYGKDAKYYTDKIVELCKQENIDVIFLTLPMYSKHVKNFSAWEKRLSEVIGTHKDRWLNLQTNEHIGDFAPESFENTYENNQHMTYNGSLVATYKLAEFIKKKSPGKLKDRSKDPEWIALFSPIDGYFYNQRPAKGDTLRSILAEDIIVRGIKVKDVRLEETKDANLIMARVPKDQLKGIDPEGKTFKISFRYDNNGTENVAFIDLLFDKYHIPPDYYIFTQGIKPVKITGIVDERKPD